jgi:hypothetical protein
MNAEVIPLFGPDRMTPELRRRLRKRVADLTVEMAFLESERERLESLLKDESI